jgi:hypothetical protein
MEISQPATAGSDGRKERPVQTASVFAPKVLSLDGDHLVWDSNQPSTKRPSPVLLDDFSALADATPEQIFDFAQRWGALVIKTTAMPGFRFREPVASWRGLAIRFRALHRIGVDLNCGKLGAIEDWKALGLELPVRNTSYSALEEARFAVMSNIGRLVREAGLHPRLYWDKPAKQWRIDFDTFSRTNLLAVLVLRLMIAIADKDGFAICSGCQRSYPPERQPSVGRRNYCPTCRESGIPYRDSKRELRRRKREENAKTKSRRV